MNDKTKPTSRPSVADPVGFLILSTVVPIAKGEDPHEVVKAIVSAQHPAVPAGSFGFVQTMSVEQGRKMYEDCRRESAEAEGIIEAVDPVTGVCVETDHDTMFNNDHDLDAETQQRLDDAVKQKMN